MATTWELAFAHLERSAPAAAGLLRLLAYCAAEDIPLGRLLQPRPGLTDDLAPAVAEVLTPLLDDELAAGDAVAALREYSLARPAGPGQCRCGIDALSRAGGCAERWCRQGE